MMSSVATTAMPRRFTILDGTVLTIVMAMAFLAARSTWPDLAQVVRTIQPRMLFDPDYFWGGFRDDPHFNRQFASVAVLVGQTLANTLDLTGGRSRIFWIPTQGPLLIGLRATIIVAFPVLVYLPFALLLLRVVKPRPAWEEIFRQPGCSACLAIVGSLFVAAWAEIGAEIRVPMSSVAAILALTWIIQATTKRWRTEPSWLDRAGRVLGVGWVLAGVAAAI